MRRALVVGINHYDHISPLYGCVDDAHAMKAVLDRNADGTVNFQVKLLTGTGPTDRVDLSQLREAVRELFAHDADIAFLYFAGHGAILDTGGYLCTTDCRTADDGHPLADVLVRANQSPARNRVIVLDSCHSGIAGNAPTSADVASLAQGITILTASTEKQYATEENGSGVFTSLFVDAMNGAASNLVGDVTPGSVYAHVDQSLGPWQQRPVFKTNVKFFVSLRKTTPPIAFADLIRVKDLFPSPGFVFQLDPSFEPERPTVLDEGIPPPDPINTEKFAVLQKLVKVNLVVPVDAPHMWHAAMNSKGCKLTVLGEHYRRLFEKELL
jgi:hypothetical protein